MPLSRKGELRKRFCVSLHCGYAILWRGVSNQHKNKRLILCPLESKIFMESLSILDYIFWEESVLHYCWSSRWIATIEKDSLLTPLAIWRRNAKWNFQRTCGISVLNCQMWRDWCVHIEPWPSRTGCRPATVSRYWKETQRIYFRGVGWFPWSDNNSQGMKRPRSSSNRDLAGKSLFCSPIEDRKHMVPVRSLIRL